MSFFWKELALTPTYFEGKMRTGRRTEALCLQKERVADSRCDISMGSQTIESAQGEDDDDLILPRAKRQAVMDAVHEPSTRPS